MISKRHRLIKSAGFRHMLKTNLYYRRLSKTFVPVASGMMDACCLSIGASIGFIGAYASYYGVNPFLLASFIATSLAGDQLRISQ